MPCRDEFSEFEDRNRDREKSANLEATLCGVLTLLKAQGGNSDIDILNKVDWIEAGVSRKWAIEWWTDHQRVDNERRHREAAEARKKAAREVALAKLTAEELKLLGIK